MHRPVGLIGLTQRRCRRGFSHVRIMKARPATVRRLQSKKGYQRKALAALNSRRISAPGLSSHSRWRPTAPNGPSARIGLTDLRVARHDHIAPDTHAAAANLVRQIALGIGLRAVLLCDLRKAGPTNLRSRPWQRMQSAPSTSFRAAASSGLAATSASAAFSAVLTRMMRQPMLATPRASQHDQPDQPANPARPGRIVSSSSMGSVIPSRFTKKYGRQTPATEHKPKTGMPYQRDTEQAPPRSEVSSPPAQREGRRDSASGAISA
jgi:hypothetical protein